MLLFVSYIYIYIIVASKRNKERIAPGLSTQIQLSVILKKKIWIWHSNSKEKKNLFYQRAQSQIPGILHHYLTQQMRLSDLIFFLLLTLSLTMTSFEVFQDYFNFNHFFATSCCFQKKGPSSLAFALNFT